MDLLLDSILSHLPEKSILVFAGVNIIMAWGFWIMIATGQLSLGNSAFMAMGAYFAGVITVKWHWPLPLGFAGAILVGAVAGAIVGWPALRIRGMYLAMATIGVEEVVQIFFKNFEYTGANVGLNGMRGTTVELVFAIVFVLFLFFLKLSNSRLGNAMEAIRSDEVAAGAMGLNTTYVKMVAFMLGAVMASMAGVLYAHFMFFIAPEHFGVMQSIYPVLFVAMGSVETFWGAAFGAIFLTLLPEYIRFMSEWRNVLYGVLIILIMALRPQGLISRSVVLRVSRVFGGRRPSPKTANSKL
ncbi:MAG: branched-chain amino acid ABC transporter permease [Dehalococcoidia bacterium]|nr:branched-chain amino acid ABC transporter permease [Dehalococcoidia bacterium]